MGAIEVILMNRVDESAALLYDDGDDALTSSFDTPPDPVRRGRMHTRPLMSARLYAHDRMPPHTRQRHPGQSRAVCIVIKLMFGVE